MWVINAFLILNSIGDRIVVPVVSLKGIVQHFGTICLLVVGFCSFHSMETALVNITSDLLIATDSWLLTILVLLDLSAALDTISHNIFLVRLASIEIIGTCLV